MSSDDRGREWAVKVGANVQSDALALAIIEKSGIDIPAVHLHASFIWEGETGLIMEKVKSPLLEDIPTSEKALYLESMLFDLRRIHAIKSGRAGFLNNKAVNQSWQEYLQAKYSGQHELYLWKKIARRQGVDADLVLGSVARARDIIVQSSLPQGHYSLSHTDFNQRNLFVDPKAHKIAAIIDWGEAIFGDPLYDFARVRMFILHFNLGHVALSKYHEILDLSQEEKTREELYFVIQMLDYIKWYSEKKNSLNDGRLRLHQKFLSEYEW